MRQVCQKWKNLTEHSPEIRKDLHLKFNAWELKNLNFEILKTTKTKFYQLSLIQCEYSQISEDVWKNILPHIKILSLRYCLTMSLTDFHNILKLTKDLETIQIFDHFPSLGVGYKLESFLSFDWPVGKIKQFEMFRASAVDNQKLEIFVDKMSNLELFRIESRVFERLENTIFNIINNKLMTLKTLILVDNKEEAGADKILVMLTSLFSNNLNGSVDHMDYMEVDCCGGPKLLKFGCRLDKVIMTPVLREFIEYYGLIQVFEVWTDEAVLDPNFLFDMFEYSSSLRKIIIHCDQFDKTFTRNEVILHKQHGLKKIVFFPD
uniref:CSON013931 protein n=1 Tax=Culicoides sonorensis TaxID=179676 RepID=A0A336MDI7_CULSO